MVVGCCLFGGPCSLNTKHNASQGQIFGTYLIVAKLMGFIGGGCLSQLGSVRVKGIRFRLQALGFGALGARVRWSGLRV